MEAYLFIGGEARGAVGPAACSFVLADAGGNRLAYGGWFLGTSTGVIASYLGLIWGMRNAVDAEVEKLTVFTDVRSLVAQLHGDAPAKGHLKSLLAQVRAFSEGFEEFSVAHIQRSENKQANRYLQEALAESGYVGVFEVAPDGSTAFSHDETRVRKAAPVGAPDDEFDGPEDAPSLLIESVDLNDDYLSRRGTYGLVVKERFRVTADRYEEPLAWTVQARVCSSVLDGDGRMYAVDDLKADLQHALEAFDGKELSTVPPFGQLPFTMEHLVRIIYWDLAKRLPSYVDLAEVSLWSNELGAKLTYEPLPDEPPAKPIAGGSAS